jgi:hypothetical protein
LKGKTYRDAQLEELAHSVVVEHTPEHEVVCGSKPTREKRREGETAAEPQPPQASGCDRNVITGMTTWSSGNTASREI